MYETNTTQELIDMLKLDLDMYESGDADPMADDNAAQSKQVLAEIEKRCRNAIR